MNTRWFFALGVLCSTINLSLAADFFVTSSNCTGAGSIMEAIRQANTNLGHDNIIFTPGLTVNIDKDSCGFDVFQQGFSFYNFYLGVVNESVSFIGNGALLSGCQIWLNNRLQWNAVGSGVCPQDDLAWLRCYSPGFIRVGERGLNNNGIRVDVSNLRAKNLEQLVQLEEGASLNIDGSYFESIFPLEQCTVSPIVGEGLNVINVTRTTFKDCWTWDKRRDTIYNGLGVINSNGPSLYVYNSSFVQCKTQYSITFNGQSSADVANIVSSRFEGLSEGLFAFKGTMNIINSLINFGYPFYSASQFHRIVAGPLSIINLVASTVVINSAQVQPGTCSHHTVTVHPQKSIGLESSIYHSLDGMYLL